jgi:hypothetical protein
VDAKDRQYLSESRRTAKEFDTETFNLKTLNDVEVKEQYQVKISKRFAALENLGDDVASVGLWKLSDR